MKEGAVGIFWDLDTFPPPSDGLVLEVVNSIENLAHEYGSVKSFRAYSDDLESSTMTSSLCSGLQVAGVSLVDCSHDTSKNGIVTVDLFTYAMQHPHPATIILVSSQQLLTYALSVLRLRQFRIILIASPSVPASLKHRASEFRDWDSMMPQDGDAAVQASQSAASLVDRSEALHNSLKLLSPASPVARDLESHAGVPFPEALASQALPTPQNTVVSTAMLDSDHHPALSLSTVSTTSQSSEATMPSLLASQPVVPAHSLSPHEPVEDITLENGPSATNRSELHKFQSNEAVAQVEFDDKLASGTGSFEGGEGGNGTPYGSSQDNLNGQELLKQAIALETPGDGSHAKLEHVELASSTYRPSQSHIPNPLVLFRGLIEEIQEHGSHPDRSKVAIGLMRRDPSAYTRTGVASFKAFTTLAVDAGVVTLGNHRNERGKPFSTIYLTSGWQNPDDQMSTSERSIGMSNWLATPSQPRAPKFSSSTHLARFQTLIDEIQRWPVPCPAFTAVTAELMKQDHFAHAYYGPADLDEYIAQAIKAEIVDLGETIHADGTTIRWICLGPACQILADTEDILPKAPTGSASQRSTTQPSTPVNTVVLPPVAGSSVGRNTASPSGSVPPQASPPNHPPMSPIFQGLVEMLQHHDRMTRSDAAVGFYELFKKESATFLSLGVRKARHLFKLAAAEGIVTLGDTKVEKKLVQWVSLAPALRVVASDTPTPVQTAASPKMIIEQALPGLSPAGFRPLVAVLQELRSYGISQRLCSRVDQELLAQNPSIYKEVGVQNFLEYANLAQYAGVVRLGTGPDAGCISLV